MNAKPISERHRRSYSPEGLMVLKGPGEDYKQGSYWMVGDEHGYAEIILMEDSNAYHPNSLYIEHIVVKEPERGNGYGRTLYLLVEQFARQIGVDYIQLDSEPEAYGFWVKMGYKKIDAVYYQNKTAMIKEIRKAS
ncbi:MAG: GNAT family N-acetyltransferase [Candidatus Bathyarchaeota archaeon]|nr:GNAT family N-acetyltransferase [Candidatus Bathyarchaeota archaeon]